MGFRTVIVNSRAKLEFRLNFMIVRGENEKRIFIDEINTLIVQSTAVSLTAALLSELIRSGVKVIFCDEKFNPCSELIPYYGAHNTSKRYKIQMQWRDETKNEIWRLIIVQKITNQKNYLQKRGFIAEAELIGSYIPDILPGDTTNREGHSAKVYFNCLMPCGVSRRDGGFLNGCLNYGYAVLLSCFNREIVASGYLTQFGIWHDNEFNQFNLSSDLMEPFRTIVDEVAFSLPEGDKEFKRKMADILNFQISIDGKTTTLDLAVRTYVRSVLNALEASDPSLIIFPSYEL